MKRKIFYLFTFLLFANCGFTPLYDSNNIKYKINIIEISGDNTINTAMMNEIRRISRSTSKKEFNIKINSNYENTIKENFATSFVRKLNLELSSK